MRWQGHKRWEKAVSTGYENIRRLTHECLLPALERCQVLLSRLIGISKFHKLSHVLGLETRDLQEIVDTVDCLHLLSHNILTHSGRELREFVAFAKWLRYEIDIQTAEPMSQTLEELMEKSDMIDHGATLDYIQGALTKSSLRSFIQTLPGMAGIGAIKPPSGTSNKWAPGGNDSTFYETYRKMLAQREQREAGHGHSSPLDLPKLNDLTGRLGLQCERVFGQIALTQRRGILHRCPLILHPDCDRNTIDIAMCYEVRQLDGMIGTPANEYFALDC
jgi:anaphase-promoting complex subunit 4